MKVQPFVEVYVQGGARHVAKTIHENRESGSFRQSVCGVGGPLLPSRYDAGDVFWRVYPKCGRCQRWMRIRAWDWPSPREGGQ